MLGLGKVHKNKALIPKINKKNKLEIASSSTETRTRKDQISVSGASRIENQSQRSSQEVYY